MADNTTTKHTVFLTGATGYIGGAVLQKLLGDPSFAITALVRSANKAAALNSLGVQTIVGSLDDASLLEQTAAAVDIVIHTADADGLSAIRSILKGMKARRDARGVAPVLLHTSGTGVLMDDAEGDCATETVYVDSDAAQMAGIPESAVHRNVDLEILRADAAGDIRGHIVLPSTIYGALTGPLVDAGIANPRTIQIPALIRASIRMGQGAIVGRGESIWPSIEIHELAEMYMVVLSAAIAGTAPHGVQGYYFGESGEYKLRDAAEVYTKTLHALGKSKTPEPVTFTKEDIVKYARGTTIGMGTNSRARGEQARKLGWVPKCNSADFLKDVEAETRWIVAHPETLETAKY